MCPVFAVWLLLPHRANAGRTGKKGDYHRCAGTHRVTFLVGGYAAAPFHAKAVAGGVTGETSSVVITANPRERTLHAGTRSADDKGACK